MDYKLLDALIAEIEDIRARIFGHDGTLAVHLRKLIPEKNDPPSHTPEHPPHSQQEKK